MTRYETIIDYVTNHPGCTGVEVRNGTGLHHVTCMTGLTILTGKGRLVRSGQRRAYVYHLASRRRRPAPLTLAMTPQRQMILDYVTQHPGCSGTEIVEATGLRCRQQLRMMTMGGLLVCTGAYREYRYTAAPQPVVLLDVA